MSTANERAERLRTIAQLVLSELDRRMEEEMGSPLSAHDQTDLGVGQAMCKQLAVDIQHGTIPDSWVSLLCLEELEPEPKAPAVPRIAYRALQGGVCLWHPVGRALPDNTRHVLIAVKNALDPYAARLEGDTWYYRDGLVVSDESTHWMEMPRWLETEDPEDAKPNQVHRVEITVNSNQDPTRIAKVVTEELRKVAQQRKADNREKCTTCRHVISRPGFFGCGAPHVCDAVNGYQGWEAREDTPRIGLDTQKAEEDAAILGASPTGVDQPATEPKAIVTRREELTAELRERRAHLRECQHCHESPPGLEKPVCRKCHDATKAGTAHHPEWRDRYLVGTPEDLERVRGVAWRTTPRPV